MIKPKTRIAMKEAFKGLKPEIDKLRKETPSKFAMWCRDTYLMSGGEMLGNIVDTYVVPLSELDTKEVRALNAELGLDTHEGINKWYKKS